jgi:hypothetical protein
MGRDIGRLLEEMRDIQEQLEQFFDEARERFRYTLEGGRVRFSMEMQQLHLRYRVSSLRYLLDADLLSVLTAPLVYLMIVPLVFMDAGLTLYQQTCFRAYGVPRVRRRDYLVNDRHKLGYLNTVEKINCTYCGYANGMVAYAREIVARTEQYWCPIRHARRVSYAHLRYPKFFAYGDAASYQQGLAGKRGELEHEVPAAGEEAEGT